MSLFIDVHALHTLPPSNPNRDDTGAPKTAIFGSVPRQRVSSQAWKRAIRNDFREYLNPEDLGVRTKRVVEKTVEAIKQLDSSWDRDRAAVGVEAVLNAAKIKPQPVGSKEQEDGEESPLSQTTYLLFLSNHQIQRLARYVIENEGVKPSKRDAATLLDQEQSVDIALFGRMVADAPDYNVDAATQVAHAIGVSAAEPEFDYYTAVDDVVEDAEETGAGMIGTMQMMSSTLYRYATVNVEQLRENLASEEAAAKASVAFVKSFIRSMPTGKQNSYANRTMPEAVVVSLRKDRPISWVNAFEEAVPAQESRRRAAAKKLAKEAQSIETAYSAPAQKTWVLALDDLKEALNGLGDTVDYETLLDELGNTLAAEEN